MNNETYDLIYSAWLLVSDGIRLSDESIAPNNSISNTPIATLFEPTESAGEVTEFGQITSRIMTDLATRNTRTKRKTTMKF